MMNTATIEKALALLNSGKAENLSVLNDLLLYERERSILEAAGKKMKLAPIIKKVLDKSKGNRPVLATVMYDTLNRPIVCDGYILVRWNKEQPELKAFPETRGESVLKADNIIPEQYRCTERELTENDRIILLNIDKYIKLYEKAKDDFKNIPVCLFGKIFNARLVKDFIGIIGTDFDKTYTEAEYSPNAIFHEDYSAVILPMRLLKEEDKKACIDRTEEFIAKIKG